MQRKTKQEIVDETIAFYTQNPRSVLEGGNSCVYLNVENNTRCAFSRCCTEEAVTELHSKYEGYGIANSRFGHDLDTKILKEEYHGHEAEFWNRLQNLHDNKNNWFQTSTGNELTFIGENAVVEMKKDFNF